MHPFYILIKKNEYLKLIGSEIQSCNITDYLGHCGKAIKLNMVNNCNDFFLNIFLD